jgi:mRNA-decapping enzyme subunit 2
VREKDPTLRPLTIQRFTELLFRQLPEYQPYAHPDTIDDIVTQWKNYSSQIPRAGGILLNPEMDKVLLIRGTKSSASWGFPRGKIGAKDETYEECAAREVWEETG